MPCRIAPEPLKSSPLPALRGETEGAGFGVYVHWPFCQSKCPYCDFNSHVRNHGVDEPRYLDAYLAELDYWRRHSGARRVDTVFFGGGTPSLMQPGTVAAILERIAGCWHLPADAEITLEANPSSVEADRFAALRAVGVNRVSLGVQALDNRALRALGRLHSCAEALEALAIARKAFERVSFDLIYARPGQSIDDWRRELARALELGGDHLSLYQLTIEPDTAYADLQAAGKLRIPDDDTAAELYEATQELCENAGLPAYEISNHARPGEECRHNLLYWRMGDYVGVGPGAHSRLTQANGRRACVAIRNPESWRESVESRGHGLAENKSLAPATAAREMLLMGLRLSEGLSLPRHAAAGGRVDPAKAAWLEEQGLVERRGDILRATANGRLVLNRVISELSN